MILCFKPYIFASPPGLYTIGTGHAELSGRGRRRGSHARVARLLHFRYKVALQHAVVRRIARRRIARRTA